MAEFKLPDVGEGLEAHLQLLADASDASAVAEGRDDPALLGADDLLVGGGGHARAAVWLSHRHRG